MKCIWKNCPHEGHEGGYGPLCKRHESMRSELFKVDEDVYEDDEVLIHYMEHPSDYHFFPFIGFQWGEFEQSYTFDD